MSTFSFNLFKTILKSSLYTTLSFSKCVFFIFFLINSHASLDLSQNIAFLAPLLNASNPIAPLPENKSKKTVSLTSF